MSASTPRIAAARVVRHRRQRLHQASAAVEQPLRHRRRLPARDARRTRPSTARHDLEHRAMLGLEEAVRDAAVDLRQEAVEVAVDIDEHERLRRGCRAGPTWPSRTARRTCRSRPAARRTRRRARPCSVLRSCIVGHHAEARSGPGGPTSRTMSCSVMTPITSPLRRQRRFRRDLHEPTLPPP